MSIELVDLNLKKYTQSHVKYNYIVCNYKNLTIGDILEFKDFSGRYWRQVLKRDGQILKLSKKIRIKCKNCCCN